MRGFLSIIDKNRAFNIVIFILFITLTVNVVRTYLNLSQRGDVLQKANLKLQQAQNQNDDLKRQLARTQSNQYIEREARNKLNMSREGEIVILMPSISPVEDPTPTPIDTSTNMEKWIKVFL